MQQTWFRCVLCIVNALAAVIISFNASAQSPGTLAQEAEIFFAWQGEYPTAHLDLLPDKQRAQPVGFIDNGETFAAVWQFFKPGEEPPAIDFVRDMVLFTRNTQFFNRISIGQVTLNNGIAEVVAMETMSAMPIEDKAGMAMVVVPKKGIRAIKAGDEIILLDKLQ